MELLCLHTRETELSPYRNLAFERRFFDALQPGQAGLYLWQNAPTVVIGRNQNVWKECDLQTMRADGVLLSRRITGGGAVYHDPRNLNFSFVNCAADYDKHRNFAILLEAMRTLGINAELSGRNDLVVQGRKFSGNAFFKNSVHTLHHGTLMLGVNMDALSRYLRPNPLKLRAKGVDSVRSRVINLGEIVPNLTIPQVKQAILTAWAQTYGSSVDNVHPFTLTEEEVKAEAEKNASEAWLYAQNPGGTMLAEAQFPWGNLVIFRQTETAARQTPRHILFSDALDADWIEEMNTALRSEGLEPFYNLRQGTLTPERLQIWQDTANTLAPHLE